MQLTAYSVGCICNVVRRLTKQGKGVANEETIEYVRIWKLQT